MLAPRDVLENRFEIEDVVRRAEAFTLYRAKDREKRRSVLVRELPCTARERERAVKQFLAEAQVRMKAKHLTLAEMYAAFEHEGYVYTVLEDVEGIPLKEVIASSLPDEADVLRWAGELIRMLEHVTSRFNLVVRELRPASIVLDGGQLKVLDTGMSRILRGGGDQRKGSRPEIRALGGCLYELLTQIPAPELSDRPIAGELFRKVNLVNPDVSEEIADAIERMVDPLAESFKSLEDVKLYLGLSGQPIPHREKKERARKSDHLFDPERMDPAEERAAIRTLLAVGCVAALLMFGLIQLERWRAGATPAIPIPEAPVVRHGPFKWTPDRIALKDYLDDLGGFAHYEARALNTHTWIARKHQVQAASDAQFEKILNDVVIPSYQIFVDNMRVVVCQNKDIDAAQRAYIKGARLILLGFKEQRIALHAGDMKGLDQANQYIEQGNLYVGLWTQQVRELERRYGLYADAQPAASPAAR